ncbi:Beta-barrel assembly-enhancing protease [Pseudomonas fluorescens]|uniref:HEAT repeat domain-containing protein n=1 Tax=Pseudomonas fluorescens TaxID=294 RepID=UPI001251E334|nr:HEAT repeat domain-containing protein [Pseudomonas fluorescens]CAG8863759.1 Beta-barrel assembly-enhancing protease [Pseudomonas fluorescens]VVP70146.1 Beta-barrel assembly-enhancing protease [Pseudomonas fluorescens]
MPKRRLYLIALLSLIVGLCVFGYLRDDNSPAPSTVPSYSYSKALRQAHDGLPGAARVLYQQLQRSDLTPIRRAALYAELPNYPSPSALKLASQDLKHEDPMVRRAAIACIARMLPEAQRSLVLGPMLEDQDQGVRFAGVDALLGLGPDDIGLYIGTLQTALEQYRQALQIQPDDAAAQLHLARLYLHDDDFEQAAAALQQSLRTAPDSLDALATQVLLLERQGHHDASRQVLAKALALQPDSAFLQHELGLWLTRHDQDEYALLAFSRAAELEPDNTAYRQALAIALHGLDQLDAAQRQLETVLSQQPANRQARVLLIEYSKETGQLQNVQVLLAQLEQQNPDDPLVQQGL